MRHQPWVQWLLPRDWKLATLGPRPGLEHRPPLWKSVLFQAPGLSSEPRSWVALGSSRGWCPHCKAPGQAERRDWAHLGVWCLPGYCVAFRNLSVPPRYRSFLSAEAPVPSLGNQVGGLDSRFKAKNGIRLIPEMLSPFPCPRRCSCQKSPDEWSAVQKVKRDDRAGRWCALNLVGKLLAFWPHGSRTPFITWPVLTNRDH